MTTTVAPEPPNLYIKGPEAEAEPEKPEFTPDAILYTMNEYHYYMNCRDEVEMRIYNDFLARDPKLPLQPQFTIPEKSYYRFDTYNYTPEELVNSGKAFILKMLKDPWGWSDVDKFMFLVSEHGQEMMSWASDEVKQFWKTRHSWIKDEFSEMRWFLWGYEQNLVYKFCSGLPSYKSKYGLPVRKNGCNPKYPYTSWHDEGFDSTAEECDGAFKHSYNRAVEEYLRPE